MYLYYPKYFKSFQIQAIFTSDMDRLLSLHANDITYVLHFISNLIL